MATVRTSSTVTNANAKLLMKVRYSKCELNGVDTHEISVLKARSQRTISWPIAGGFKKRCVPLDGRHCVPRPTRQLVASVNKP